MGFGTYRVAMYALMTAVQNLTRPPKPAIHQAVDHSVIKVFAVGWSSEGPRNLQRSTCVAKKPRSIKVREIRG
eukprot:3322083-Pyramimonas_sp.AAC.1